MELAAATSADTPVYDELLAQLQRIEPGLYLEFSAGHGSDELIVTAHGDRSLFDVARTVVAAAPRVDGWSIMALKPALGFPVSTRWNQCTIKISELRFIPLERQGQKELDLRVVVPGITDAEFDDARSAVLCALDHGLGEERCATWIGGIEIRPSFEHDPPRPPLPLLKLDEFLRQRESRK